MVVELPAWFEALNGDYRYQLTPIGDAAPLYVAAEVADNGFRIAGGRAGLKLSWQVTGVRRDAYAMANRVPGEGKSRPSSSVIASTPRPSDFRRRRALQRRRRRHAGRRRARARGMLRKPPPSRRASVANAGSSERRQQQRAGSSERRQRRVVPRRAAAPAIRGRHRSIDHKGRQGPPAVLPVSPSRQFVGTRARV